MVLEIELRGLFMLGNRSGKGVTFSAQEVELVIVNEADSLGTVIRKSYVEGTLQTSWLRACIWPHAPSDVGRTMY